MIHDAIDSKRIMSIVVLALMPALLFGMYNVGYQHFKAAGAEAFASATFWQMFFTDSWQYYLKYWYLTLLA